VAPALQLAHVRLTATVLESRVIDLSFPIDIRDEFLNTIGR
jgi:hypothetical protein